MPEKDLAELLAGIAGSAFGSWAGVSVTGIALDSREVRPGDLFVARPGLQTHGARYLRDALARGARAVILPADIPTPAGVAGLRVADPGRVLARVAARFFGQAARRLFVIGVTGTNGKSTIAHMVAHVLRRAGHPVGVWSTPEVDSGVERFRPHLTTPEPHHLHRFFRQVLDAGWRHACIEVSSHGIVLGRVAEVPFRIGIVTNLSADHLDFHGSLEGYFQAKKAFVDSLPRDAWCLLNADEPWVMRMAKDARARVITYGLAPGAALQARDPVYTPDGTRYLLQVDPSVLPGAATRVPLAIPLLGRHNVTNSLAAAGAALAAGVPPAKVRRALATFRPPLRRLETRRVGPYTVINDVAMNEASYEAVMEAMSLLALPDLVVVNAIRGNRGSAVNADSARVLARWNRRLQFAPLIVTLSRTHLRRYPADYQVRPDELAAFTAAAADGGLPLSIHSELPDAIQEAVERLRPRGVLLLLGTFGMDEGTFIAEELLRQRLHRHSAGHPQARGEAEQ